MIFLPSCRGRRDANFDTNISKTSKSHLYALLSKNGSIVAPIQYIIYLIIILIYLIDTISIDNLTFSIRSCIQDTLSSRALCSAFRPSALAKVSCIQNTSTLHDERYLACK